MMTPSSDRPAARRSLREILASPGCLIASSVFDPISARMARALGSEVGVLGGSVASHTVLGAPDIVLLTATELVDQARRICRTDAVNLLVDADHGYGNALNVMRTVQDLQAAGVAGACIEDSVLPRQYGSSDVQGLVSVEEGTRKMQAAIQARGAGRTAGLALTDAGAPMKGPHGAYALPTCWRWALTRLSHGPRRRDCRPVRLIRRPKAVSSIT